jgi:hypothetical protein
LTECGDLSEAEAEETETAVVAVKTAETVEALETAAVTIMTAVLTIKAAATLVMTTAAAAVMALIEVAVTERAVAVYRRGRWFISNVSDVRTMWNITADGDAGSHRLSVSRLPESRWTIGPRSHWL